MKNLPNKLFRYRLITLLLSLAGLLVALYSASSHYKNYTDPQYSSFCALTQAINCDTVAQSPWSILLGLPVAWWGVLFFLSLCTFLLTHNKTMPLAWRPLLSVMLIASLASLALAGLSVWKIHSICILCLATYAIIFILTFFCWLAYRLQKTAIVSTTLGQGHKTPIRSPASAVSVFFLGSILLYLFLPNYWTNSFSSDISSLPQGITEEGHPWIGAENPQLTITQFSDYQCFQCAKMHFLLRRLLVSHPESIRLIHRNYPMDHAVNPQVVPEPFHEGSGQLAKIAILAAFRNKFWQTNDYLYALGRNKRKKIPLQEIADATGLDIKELAASLTNPEIQEILRRDIWRGMKLGITGTPAFLIKGNVYQGRIPKEIFDTISSFPEKK